MKTSVRTRLPRFIRCICLTIIIAFLPVCQCVLLLLALTTLCVRLKCNNMSLSVYVFTVVVFAFTALANWPALKDVGVDVCACVYKT